MKVKIGDELYDSDSEPILLILSPRDRLNIIGMRPDADMYVGFPLGSNLKMIEQWVASTPGVLGGGKDMPPLYLVDKIRGSD